jgi:CRISPR/Cas system-associated endonuclease Cas1
MIDNKTDIKFQAIVDLFTIIFKRDEIEKRMFVVSGEVNKLLDTDKNNITERVKKLDYIIEKINESITTSVAEKKQFGEVFTPIKLINEMLDTLPVEVWSNPKLKRW